MCPTLRILGLSMAGVGPDTETQGSGAEPNPIPICLRARSLRACRKVTLETFSHFQMILGPCKQEPPVTCNPAARVFSLPPPVT